MATPNFDPVDNSFVVFRNLKKELEALDKGSWSEADTRLKAFDRILFDVLGWGRNDAQVEDVAGKGYTDYTLRDKGVSRVIVEAKKDAVSFQLGNRTSGQAYKLNGPVFNAAARDAITQTITYAAFKGCELGCATNGTEWIVLRANRLGDGLETLDGKGFIFGSLEGIENNFRLFFDLLSPVSVATLRFRGEFQKAEGTPLRDLSFFKPLRAPNTKRLLPRNEFAADFDALMGSFFERLKGDRDAEMIQKCFVVTPESELADRKLLRVADDLVGKLRRLDVETGQQLVDLIEAAKTQNKNRFALLVGNKGAGKSTFIERFFRFVLPADIAKYLVVLRVDLALSPGDESTVVKWLDAEVLAKCEQTVFSSDAPSWDECIGKMFFDEYQRWSAGTMSHLYATDKNQFRIEFGRHIEKIRETQPHEYVKRLLNFITHSNKKIPCLIFDNTEPLHNQIPRGCISIRALALRERALHRYRAHY